MHPIAQYFQQSFSVGGMHQLPPAVAPLIIGGIFVVLIWSFVWKGIALWHSSRNHQTGWFIILLIVNTVGILEIVYLLFFRKNRNKNLTTTTVTHTTVVTPPVVPPAVDSSAPVA
jgi:hypothetical protein